MLGMSACGSRQRRARSPLGDASSRIVLHTDCPSMSDLSFERDILPLFRAEDIESMSFAFDLASYDDVREHAEEIHARLADGSMPCDAPWPAEQVDLFHDWIDAGAPR